MFNEVTTHVFLLCLRDLQPSGIRFETIVIIELAHSQMAVR